MNMKKTLSLFMALILSLSLSTAQQLQISRTSAIEAAKANRVVENSNSTEYFRLGHCSDEINFGFGIGLEAGGDIAAMTELKANFLSPYIGDQISGARIGISQDITYVTVVVRETLTGSNVASKTINAVQGWNTVIFDTPVTIETGKNYYIGYTASLPPKSFPIAVGQSYVSIGSNILQINGGSFDDYTGQFGALAIQALLSGNDDHFTNKSEINSVDMKRFIPRGTSELKPTIHVSNSGINKVSELEIECKVAGKEPVKVVETVDMAAYESVSLKPVFSGLNLEENGKVAFRISRVNGKEYAGHAIEVNIQLYNGEDAVSRTILMEQFTTERCSNCPAATRTLQAVLEKEDYSNSVIWVSHHSGYHTDNFTIPASESYLRFFGAGNGTYAPAMMVDRTIFEDFGNVPVNGIGGDDYVMDYFNQALEAPSFVTVNIEQKNRINQQEKVADITVSGVWSGDMPTDDLYVNIFLTEDGLTTRGQSGAAGLYTHNNVLRSVPTGTGGTKISWEGNHYSVNVTLPINNLWKTENMNVVAFVAKNYTNVLNNTQVENAAKEKFSVTTDVEHSYLETIKLYVKGGTVQVDGDFTEIKVYDAKGVEMINAGLTPGAYIVKVKNGNSEAVKKLIVH